MRGLGFCAALFLSTLPSDASSKPRTGTIDVGAWLDRAGVSLVAVTFYSRTCRSCVDEVPKWRKLHKKYKTAGLRVLVVSEDVGGRCDRPPWQPDQVVCDSGKIARAFQRKKDAPSALLWSWQGQLLLEGGNAASVAGRIPVALSARPEVRLHGTHPKEARRYLERALERSGRARLGRDGDPIAPNMPSCGDLTPLPSPLTLGIREVKGQLELRLASTACLVREARAPWSPSRAKSATEAAVKKLLAGLRKDLAMPGLSSRVAHTPQPIRATPPPTKQKPLTPRAFAEEWIGVRYLKNGDSRKGIDAANFVRRLYDAVYGFVPGTSTKDIYRNGTLIPLDENNPLPSLQVGDLLFLTSHADRPRHVMVYLGNGEMAHATDIRGVVIDPVPESQPTYLWLVATRPDRPIGSGNDRSPP